MQFLSQKRMVKSARVVIYNVPNFNLQISLKNLFKVERYQLKWNLIGTALLALISTDHDTTNKSYYVETNLYLLGIAGSYSRIDFKKIETGSIHDITWSSSAREFTVVYMLVDTTFFDARAILSLPAEEYYIVFPHARYVLAGFGNFQGVIDVYDRQNKFQRLLLRSCKSKYLGVWVVAMWKVYIDSYHVTKIESR